MLRNIAGLILVGNILYNNYKLNYYECIVLFILMCLFSLGNFGFYFLDMFPNNSFWNFLIMGGHYWHEFPTTMFIIILFLIYLLLRNCRYEPSKIVRNVENPQETE
jgi:hypothetical protein